jgi:hypothetical protein
MNADHMNYATNLLDRHSVVYGTFAIQFPFMHLAHGTNHRQVHHESALGIYDIIAPTEAPALGSHGFLKWPGEVICGGKVVGDIIRTKGGFSLAQPF